MKIPSDIIVTQKVTEFNGNELFIHLREFVSRKQALTAFKLLKKHKPVSPKKGYLGTYEGRWYVAVLSQKDDLSWRDAFYIDAALKNGRNAFYDAPDTIFTRITEKLTGTDGWVMQPLN